MELYEIKNGLTKAHLLMTEFYQSIDIEAYRREIEGLTVITLQEGFWDDANKAKVTYDKLNKMKKTTDQYDLLETTLTSLDETYELVKNTEDQEFKEILESDYTVFEKEFMETGTRLEVLALFRIERRVESAVRQDRTQRSELLAIIMFVT